MTAVRLGTVASTSGLGRALWHDGMHGMLCGSSACCNMLRARGGVLLEVPCLPLAQVERFLESWIQGENGITYTPGGMAWASEWASNRFVGNAAMIAAVYASHIQGA